MGLAQQAIANCAVSFGLYQCILLDHQSWYSNQVSLKDCETCCDLLRPFHFEEKWRHRSDAISKSRRDALVQPHFFGCQSGQRSHWCKRMYWENLSMFLIFSISQYAKNQKDRPAGVICRPSLKAPGGGSFFCFLASPTAPYYCNIGSSFRMDYQAHIARIPNLMVYISWVFI